MPTTRYLLAFCAVLTCWTGVAMAQPVTEDTPASQRRTVDVLGTQRSYRLHRPSAGTPNGPRPAVILLHGLAGSGSQIQSYFGFDPVADREGFIAVYPDSLSGAWGDVRFPDQPEDAKRQTEQDVAFLNVLADELVAAGMADPKRIYLAGNSNGGLMATTMACLSPRKFAAFATITATASVHARTMCHAAKPRPLLIMNGTTDPINFWDAERAENIGYLGGDDFFALWSQLNGCWGREEVPLPDVDELDNSRVHLVKPRTCPPGGDTELYRVNGGGHHPPTLEQRPSGMFRGQRNHDVEAAEIIWAFFKRIGG